MLSAGHACPASHVCSGFNHIVTTPVLDHHIIDIISEDVSLELACSAVRRVGTARPNTLRAVDGAGGAGNRARGAISEHV